MTENDIRADAVREAQAYIARISRKGLVPLDRVLGDLAAVAQRMENGMTARGSTRTVERARFLCGIRILCARCDFDVCANPGHDSYCGDGTDPHEAMAKHKAQHHGSTEQ